MLAHAGEKTKHKIRLEEIIACVCREYAIDEKYLATPGRYRSFSEARGMAAWLILETGCGTIAQLASLTGRDATTLSTVAKHLRVRSGMDGAIADRMKRVATKLGLDALMQA